MVVMGAKGSHPTPDAGSGTVRLCLKVGAVYFGVMFVLGWGLGPVREWVIIPLFGRVIGFSVEAMIMIAALVVVVRGINWYFGIPPSLSIRIAIGLVALILLVSAETAGAWLFRGQDPAGFLFPADRFLAAVQWGLFLLFAIMPVLVRKRWTLGENIAS